MNLVERVRGLVVRHELNKVDAWEERKSKLTGHFYVRHQPTAEEILRMGDRLSEAFRLNRINDRSQGTLSGGGYAWQALICYYLNLCFAGTNAIALSSKFIPGCIKDALKVSYTSSASVQADLDVMVVNCPGLSDEIAPEKHPERAFAEFVCARFSECSVAVIQAKTNWNDNAQIPMLWNFIYRLAAAGKIPPNGLSVGSGTRHLSALRSFTYAFVTVPTNDVASFTPGKMPVLRVATMSGGAYWGRPTKSGVILSLSEFFAKNYNASNHAFPAPGAIGKAASAAMSLQDSQIDIDAFQLT